MQMEGTAGPSEWVFARNSVCSSSGNTPGMPAASSPAARSPVFLPALKWLTVPWAELGVPPTSHHGLLPRLPRTAGRDGVTKTPWLPPGSTSQEKFKDTPLGFVFSVQKRGAK